MTPPAICYRTIGHWLFYLVSCLLPSVKSRHAINGFLFLQRSGQSQMKDTKILHSIINREFLNTRTLVLVSIRKNIDCIECRIIFYAANFLYLSFRIGPNFEIGLRQLFPEKFVLISPTVHINVVCSACWYTAERSYFVILSYLAMESLGINKLAESNLLLWCHKSIKKSFSQN